MKTGKHPPWNKGRPGLYKHSKETLAKIPHNGMLGKKHSTETKKKMKAASANGTYSFKIGHKPAYSVNSTYKQGWYDINGKRMYFRSSWEVNYALYLDWLKKINEIANWEYEADVFIFEKIKFGTRSYRPDFKIFHHDGTFHYDEVKGYMDAASATKLKRMRIYYPHIIVTLIDSKAYSSIKSKVGKMLNFV